MRALLSLTNPWTLLILVALLSGATTLGWRLGGDHIIASQAKTQDLIDKVRSQAQLGAADAISKIDIKQTTIRQTLEHTLRENTIYRDCLVDPVTKRLLDAARAGGDLPAAPSGSVLPGTETSPAR